MEFRLKYEGALKARGSRKIKKHVHEIRKAWHPQLKELWNHPPLNTQKEKALSPSERVSQIYQLGDFQFATVIPLAGDITVELDITLMRPEAPGKIITSGDIDNRLKTLFDSLRCPRDKQEIPSGITPEEDEQPFHCLLPDDSLITSVRVTCDRLLESGKALGNSHVFLLIHVKTKMVEPTWRAIFSCG
jgi:hypothetical protein